MKAVSHPKCVRLHAVLDEAAPNGKLYVVLEYMPAGPSMDWDKSECRFHVQTGSQIDESMARSYVSDTLQRGFLLGRVNYDIATLTSNKVCSDRFTGHDSDTRFEPLDSS